MTEDSAGGRFNRRSVLKSAGVVGATAAAGGAGLVAMSGGAAAAAVTGRAFHGHLIEGTSDDGSLHNVKVRATGVEIGWEGLDSDADFAIVLLSVDDDEESIVGYAGVDGLQGTSGESDVDDDNLEGDLLTGDTGYTAEYFQSGTDGDSATNPVTLKLTVVVFYDVTGFGLGTVTGAADDEIGSPLDEALGQLGGENHPYNYVTGENTSVLSVRVNNRDEDAEVGGNARGEVETDSNTTIDDE